MSKVRLLDQVRQTIRALHYSRSTEDSYCYWIRFYIRFHGCHHPAELTAEHVSQFLTFLAVHRNVAAATQNQALNAIVFLYNRVLQQPLDHIENVIRAKRSHRIPVVFSRPEVQLLFRNLKQPYLLMAGLMLADKTAGVEDRLREAEAKMANLQAELDRMRSAPSPEPERIEVAVVPPQVTETLAELAARAESIADSLEDQAGS